MLVLRQVRLQVLRIPRTRNDSYQILARRQIIKMKVSAAIAVADGAGNDLRPSCLCASPEKHDLSFGDGIAKFVLQSTDDRGRWRKAKNNVLGIFFRTHCDCGSKAIMLIEG